MGRLPGLELVAVTTKHSIVEGGCGGPGRDFWIFGPIGWLAVLVARRRKRQAPPQPAKDAHAETNQR